MLATGSEGAEMDKGRGHEEVGMCWAAGRRARGHIPESIACEWPGPDTPLSLSPLKKNRLPKTVTAYAHPSPVSLQSQAIFCLPLVTISPLCILPD